MPGEGAADETRELQGLRRGLGDHAVHQRNGEDHQHHHRQSVERRRFVHDPRAEPTADGERAGRRQYHDQRQAQAEIDGADVQVEIEQPQRQRRQGEWHQEVGEERQQQGKRGVESQEGGGGGGRDDAGRHGAEAKCCDQAGP
jgi:hypothetical protein